MDDVILQKTASIERCLSRVEEEYSKAGASFSKNYTHQDAAILNLQRACEQSIDLANHLIRVKKWGLPDTSRASFDLLVEHQITDSETGKHLKKMVGFRNIAVHEYANLNIEILEKIITKELRYIRDFCKAILQADV